MDTAQTADYALQVLLRLERGDGRTAGELADELSVSRSAMRRIVATLHARALLTRLGNGRYVLGPGLIPLGGSLTHELAALARPVLRELAEETEEMVVLLVPDGEDGIVVARRSGTTGPLRIEYAVGARQPLSRGAAGLVVLAFSEDDDLRRTLPAGRLADVDAVRARGYARTQGELRPYVEDIAVPVRDDAVGVVGSLAVVVPSARAERLDDVLPVLRRAAARIGDAYALDFAASGAVG